MPGYQVWSRKHPDPVWRSPGRKDYGAPPRALLSLTAEVFDTNRIRLRWILPDDDTIVYVRRYRGGIARGDVLASAGVYETDVLEPGSYVFSATTVSAAGIESATAVSAAPVVVTDSSTVGTRDWYAQPGASDAFFNVPLSTAAGVATTADPATSVMVANASKGTVNSSSWSVGRMRATAAHPVVTLRHPTTGAVWATGGEVRIDPAFTPPVGSGTFTPDGNSALFQLDGRIVDAYRLVKVSNTEWTSTSVDVYDGFGSLLQKGVRAADIGLVNGEITAAELAAVLAGTASYFPHGLGMSVPKEFLKASPTASDGYVMNGVAVYPANRQDNQANVPYSGNPGIPMGTSFTLDGAFDINTWTVAGAAPTAAQKALAETLYRYFVVVVDQSTSWALYAEPEANQAAVTELRAAIKSLMSHLRRVTTMTPSTHGGGPAPRRRNTPAAAPLAPLPVVQLREPTAYPFSPYAFSLLPRGEDMAFEEYTGVKTTALHSEDTWTVNSANWTRTLLRGDIADFSLQTVNTVNSAGTVLSTRTIWMPKVEPVLPTDDDRHLMSLQPRGVPSPHAFKLYELYKVREPSATGTAGNTGTARVWTTTYFNENDVRGHGLRAGSIASAISMYHGLLLAEKLRRAAAGDEWAFDQWLSLGVNAAVLKLRPDASDGLVSLNGSGQPVSVWPARLADTQSSTMVYGGPIPMGSAFGVPSSYTFQTGWSEIIARGGATSSTTPNWADRALFHALQDYGACALIQAENGIIYVEPQYVRNSTGSVVVDPTYNALVNDLKAAWARQRRLLRFGYQHPGQIDANREPLDWTATLGGGTRRPRPLHLPLAS